MILRSLKVTKKALECAQEASLDCSNSTLTHFTLTRLHTKKSFSLIEIAVAAAIVILTFEGIVLVFTRGAIASIKTKRQAIVSNLLREKLEEKSTASPWPPASEAFATVSGFVNFSRQVTVTPQYLGLTNLALIEVTVQWVDEKGILRSQKIQTLKAQY